MTTFTLATPLLTKLDPEELHLVENDEERKKYIPEKLAEVGLHHYVITGLGSSLHLNSIICMCVYMVFCVYIMLCLYTLYNSNNIAVLKIIRCDYKGHTSLTNP